MFNIKTLNKISNVIIETAEGLNIGKQLSESTNKASNSVSEIRGSAFYGCANLESFHYPLCLSRAAPITPW